jgi:hypothetical protein
MSKLMHSNLMNWIYSGSVHDTLGGGEFNGAFR